MNEGPPLHIAFFQFVVNYGGAVRSTVELGARLRQAGVDVTMVDVYGACEPFRNAVQQAGLNYRVVLPTPKARFIGGDNPILRLWRMLWAVPHLQAVRRQLKALLLDINPSIVVCNHFKAASLVALSPGLRHIPLIIYLRGWYRPDQLPTYGLWLCQRAHSLLALSRATKAALMCSGIDHRKIHVLHNPIDVDGFIARSDRPLSQPLPQVHRPIRLLLPGDIIASKGQHNGIEALRVVLDAGHDAVLWLAGAHSWAVGRNKTYLDRLMALADRLGVRDRVECLGLRDDIPQVMAASTMVVFPSHTEGQGRVLLEAMSLAKPIVASAAGGIMDMICHGMTGLLCEIDDSEGLARGILQYLNDSALARRVGELGQEYVRRSFTPAEQLRKAMSVFQQVAPHGPESG